MKLSAKFLKNVADVNCFQYVTQWDISEGSAHSLYFQIIDKDKESIRYITQAGLYSVEVTFLSIDDDSKITIVATQPFSDDKSIFQIYLTADQVPNPGAVDFKLTEDAVESKFKVSQAIVVDLLADGSC